MGLGYAYPWGACLAWCEYAGRAGETPEGAALRLNQRTPLPTSLLSCRKARKARTFTSDREPSGNPGYNRPLPEE